MQGNDRRLHRRSALTLSAMIVLLMIGSVSASTAEHTVVITPQPALVYDLITISATGSDTNAIEAAYGKSGGVDAGHDDWICQSFKASAAGTLSEVYTKGTGTSKNLRFFGFVSASETGAFLTAQDTADPSNTYSDLNVSVDLEAGVKYWACTQWTTGTPKPYVLESNDGNQYIQSILTEPGANATVTGTDYSAIYHMILSVKVSTGHPVRLSAILPTGDFSDPLGTGEYADSNPALTIMNPRETSGYIKTVMYSVENGWSPEVQTYLNVGTFSTGSEGASRTGIYINSSDYGFGLHNYRGFAAGSSGSYPGHILVDGAVTTTCNLDWDCMLDINPGTHTYALYSTNGGVPYIGSFTVDANTDFVNLYAPLTYNIFKIWETETQTSSTDCDDIYSLTVGGDVSTQKRIATGWYVSPDFLNWNNLNVVPQNCYSDLSIPANHPFILPGQINPTEPAVFTFSGADGIGGEMYAQYFLSGGILGTRNRNGYTNFYDLYETGTAGYVTRKTASADDGDYSPITVIGTPNMNIDSALYGDANYNPGDFALGDNVTCEAKLHSGGYVLYDVNVLLITDQNTIYAQSSFQPYKIYNPYMAEEQPSGAFNIVWHNFADVNTGHTGVIHCGFQTTNELGYTSGWVYSEPRVMYSSNYTATGGMNIFVKYEDGVTSYLGHESSYSSDANYIDIYNWYHEPYYWGYDTADNPLTLFEGDGVIAQTYDTNAGRTGSKSFDIDRGDAFNINLYLADQDTHDQSPVAFAAQMYEQSAFGDRVYCKTNFYDKDLDWSDITFSFWTGNEGSLASPLCTKNISYAYNSNCNPTDAPCMTPGATSTIMNDCGSDNDCYAETYFSKRGCTNLAAGEVTGHCAMYVNDFNDNTALVQASVSLTVPTYQLFAICDAYALIGSEKENVIFTNSEPGFIECLVGLDNVSSPTDLNWSVVFETKSLALIETIHDDYMDQDYFKFRIDATEEIETLARLRSTDGETWEGDGTVFVQHPVYGSKDSAVHITVTFVGDRVGTTAGDYTEAEFNQLYYWIDGFVKDIMTDPIGTVQARFFEVLVITLFIIIFVPLLLIMGALEAKKKSAGE